MKCLKIADHTLHVAYVKHITQLCYTEETEVRLFIYVHRCIVGVCFTQCSLRLVPFYLYVSKHHSAILWTNICYAHLNAFDIIQMVLMF